MKSNGNQEHRFHDLTIEEIKQEKGLSNLSDEEAKEIMESLKILSILAYENIVKANQLEYHD